MSARAQKIGTAHRIQELIDQEVNVLVDHHLEPLEQLRFRQGVIDGLKRGLVANEEAYKHVGD